MFIKDWDNVEGHAFDMACNWRSGKLEGIIYGLARWLGGLAMWRYVE